MPAGSSPSFPAIPATGSPAKARKVADAKNKTRTGNSLGFKPTTREKKPISKQEWEDFLAYTACGGAEKPGRKTATVAPISSFRLEKKLRTDAKARAQYDEARIAGVRSRWDQETLDEIMVHIAVGEPGTVKSALKAVFREDEIHSFYSLVLKDPQVRADYDDARMIQAERMAIDDLVELSDDTSNDETWDGKANSAAVNRSRLQVDTRKWIAARMHGRRFGDKVTQDINANIVIDHAARLEAARKRKAMRDEGRQLPAPQEEEKK